MNLSHAIRLNSLQIVDKKKRKRRQNRLRKFNFLRSILRAIIFHLVPYFLKTIRSILSFAEKHKCIIPIYRELSNYNKKKLLRRRHIISSNFIETFYVRHFKFLQPLHLFEARPNFPPSHNQPSRSSFHHRLSMTEYLVATKRSAQRSSPQRSLNRTKPPKKPPIAPSVRPGTATTPGFKVQRKDRRTQREREDGTCIYFSTIKVHATSGSSLGPSRLTPALFLLRIVDTPTIHLFSPSGIA